MENRQNSEIHATLCKILYKEEEAFAQKKFELQLTKYLQRCEKDIRPIIQTDYSRTANVGLTSQTHQFGSKNGVQSTV